MNAWIMSDLHLGSRFSRDALFLRFLDTLPADTTLILNGDTLDRHAAHLSDSHGRTLNRLRSESERRPVIWLRGNHDARVRITDPVRINFRDTWDVPGVVHVEHGSEFTSDHAIYRFFIRTFRAFHNLLIQLGAEAVHVAFYAKNFPHFYGVLRRHVRTHAVQYARRHGFPTVVCGHTHFAEDISLDGIRYVNSGSWTEEPVHVVELSGTTLQLRQFS